MFLKHKKKLVFILIISIIFLTTNIFLIYNYAHKKKHHSKNNLSQIDNNINSRLQNEYFRPKQLTDLTQTWESDKDFLKLQNEYKVPIRMAIFKTVLPNPLPGEEYNVTLGAQLLCGNIILPGEVFSLNDTLGPYSKERGFKEGPTYSGNKLITSIGGGMCKIATTLYNLAVLSNLQILERHPHSMIVQYVPLGQDATVSYGSKNLRFKNTSSSPILIWGVNKDNTLYMAFYSNTVAPKVTWNHKTLNTRNKQVIYKKSKQVPKDTTIILEGCNGYTVKSWLTIEHSNSRIENEYIGIDHYTPMNEIILNND